METDVIKQILEKGLTAELNSIYDTEIKPQLIKKLDENKDKIIAGLTLHLMKQAEFSRMGDTLNIAIKTEGLNQN